MNEEQRRIIIRRISGYGEDGGSSQGRTPPVSPINRWVALAILVPVLALLAVLGVFFFTIFVALFSIIAVILGARIWWLRKKFQRTMRQEEAGRSGQSAQAQDSSESVIVEDAEIIEETTVIREDEKSNTSGKKRQG